MTPQDTELDWRTLRHFTSNPGHWLYWKHAFGEILNPSLEAKANIVRLVDLTVAEGSGFADKAARLRPILNGLAENELATVLAAERVRQLSDAPRPGPPRGLGLQYDDIVEAARTAGFPPDDPPTQAAVADVLGKADARRLRQVIKEKESTWEEVLRAAGYLFPT